MYSMCFNVPQKVVESNGKEIVIEDFKGNRQLAKTMIKIKAGDYCLLQQGIAVEKINKEYALDAIRMLKQGGKYEQ